MRLRTCGERAVLLEPDDPAAARALGARVERARSSGRLPSVTDVVPAARTVLVVFRPGAVDLAGLRAVTAQATPDDEDATGRVVVIGVRYTGADLALVAETAGLSEAAVIDAHQGPEYRVAFCGFVPGFAYLTGLPAVLRQPRLDRPRTAVPGGSVAIADGYTAVYPRRSPGGWRLIGETDLTLFDPANDPPALLTPGDRVRFEARR